MPTDIVVAVIAFAGIALGTFGGILTSSKLINHRIQQLEKRWTNITQYVQDYLSKRDPEGRAKALEAFS